MRKLFAVLVFLSLASLAFAQRIDELNGKHTQLYPTKDKADKDLGEGKAKPGGGGSNLSNHGGPVILSAQVVAIYWGSYWGTQAGNAIKTQVDEFFGQFGTTGEYNTITQYTDASGNPILLTSLYQTGGGWLDSTNPPSTNVTDGDVQNEVSKYLKVTANVSASTIYEVFLPAGYYASYGSSDSCGGPNVQFCAYHSNFTSNGINIKYASMPYPSCGGCQWTGWSPQLNLNHFACHETREAVTDADGTAWYDRRGYEADDKCAWSPSPFIGTGSYGYQWEWSNQVGGCVQTR